MPPRRQTPSRVPLLLLDAASGIALIRVIIDAAKYQKLEKHLDQVKETPIRSINDPNLLQEAAQTSDKASLTLVEGLIAQRGWSQHREEGISLNPKNKVYCTTLMVNALNRTKLISDTFGNFKLVGMNEKGKITSIKVYPSAQETLVIKERGDYKSLVYQPGQSLWKTVKDTFGLMVSTLFGLIGVVSIYPVGEENYFMLEGDTVTILGHLKYNLSTDSLEFDNPLAVFMGGKTDYLNYLLEEQRKCLVGAGIWTMLFTSIILARFLVKKSQSLNIPNQQISGKVYEALEAENKFTEDEVKEVRQCIVCYTHPRDLIMYPCAHLVICSSCMKAIVDRGENLSDKCPICRQKLEDVIFVKKEVNDEQM